MNAPFSTRSWPEDALDGTILQYDFPRRTATYATNPQALRSDFLCDMCGDRR
jgi:hypothetical protein